MRKSMLLMSALMLTSSIASAAVWTKPEMPKEDPVSGEKYYIANVEAAKFMKGMATTHTWTTTCGLASDGLLVKLTETETGWTIQRTSDSKYTFRSGADECHVDMGSQGHNYFDFAKLESGYYTISNNADDDVYGVNMTGELQVWSYQPGAAVPTHIYCNATSETEGAFIEWTFISETAYADFSLSIQKYAAGSALEEAIAAAKAKYPSIDLADEEAVCNDPESTVEQLNAATESVKNKVKAADAAAAEATASPENPMELTSMITNPGFDGNANGWTGGPALGNGAAEFYNKNYTLAQGLSNMPKGVYALKVSGYYRTGFSQDAYNSYKAGNLNLNAKVYAINSTDTIQTPLMSEMVGIEAGEKLQEGGNYAEVKDGDYSYFLPNNMATAAFYFEAGRYADNILFFGSLGDSLTIGLKKDVTINGDWTMFDNFSLMYYGNSEASYNFWMQQLTANTPADAYDNVEMVTGSYVEEYKNVINSNNSASTYSEVIEKIALINAAKDTIEVNIALWKELVAQKTASTAVAGDDENYNTECDEMLDLGDYLDEDVTDAIDELELTNEELREMIATLKQMTTDAIFNAIKPGSEYKQLKNTDFANGWDGWVHNAASGGNVAANTTAHCAEAWNNSNFDIYQVVEGAPIGVYAIQLQGFYREGRGDNAWNLYFEEDGTERETKPASTAFIYMNEAKTPLNNVFDIRVPNGEIFTTTGELAPYVDPNGEYWYANDMTAAGQAFDVDYYKTRALGLVAQKGDKMQVGVKGRSNNLGDSWAIFTRFKLIYLGYAPEIIQPILEEQIALLSTDKLVGTEIAEKIEAVKQEANAAIEAADGKAMLKAVASIYALQEEIEASAAVFEQLKSMNEELYNAQSVSTASSDVKNEATSLYLAIEEALEGKTLSTDEANEKIEAIKLMISKLAIPADVDTASDESPVDLSAVIMNPGFDNDGVNSIEGWQNATGYNFGNDATQKAALCLEFYEKDFNMYQDLAYLPAGTYAVGVSAFFRGSEESNPVLYAVKQSGDSVAVNLIQRDSQVSDAPLAEGETELKEEEELIGYVPNNMVSARAYFDAGFYGNELIVRTTEAGSLRIGVSAKDHKQYDWCIMDDFTLTYYGTNSSKEENVGIEAVTGSKVAKIEVFNLNGQKVNMATSGVYVIRMTLEDGSVVSSKIVK